MEAKVPALAREVQRLVHTCDKRNQHMTLLEDTLEPEGGGGTAWQHQVDVQ